MDPIAQIVGLRSAKFVNEERQASESSSAFVVGS
jgi:hypothetical protein